MKKLLLVLTCIFSSLFFSSYVHANTYNTSLDFSYIDTDFYNAKKTVEIFLSSDDTYSDYFYLFYDDSTNTINVLIPLNGFDPQTNSSLINYNGGRLDTSVSWFISSGYHIYSFNNDYSNLSTYQRFGSYSFQYVNLYPYRYLYSNFVFYGKKTSSSDIWYFTYNDKTWTFNNLTTEVFYSLYDYYLDFYPSQPTDNTPILTSFYTLCIEKISLFATFFISSYIYLAIIVIIILIFVIELIRRYLL